MTCCCGSAASAGRRSPWREQLRQRSSARRQVGRRRSSAGEVVIVDLTGDHLDAMGRSELRPFLNDFAFCALSGGQPVAAGGIVEYYWQGRGYAWFADRAGGFHRRLWPAITRAVRRAVELALENGKFRRIEMSVYDRDEKAKRWAERLGFVAEAKHAKLMADGSDGWTYATWTNASAS